MRRYYRVLDEAVLIAVDLPFAYICPERKFHFYFVFVRTLFCLTNFLGKGTYTIPHHPVSGNVSEILGTLAGNYC